MQGRMKYELIEDNSNLEFKPPPPPPMNHESQLESGWLNIMGEFGLRWN